MEAVIDHVGKRKGRTCGFHHRSRQVAGYLPDLQTPLLVYLAKYGYDVCTGNAADHGHQCTLPAMSVLVGHYGEHLISAQCRLVDAEELATVLRIQHIARRTILKHLHSFPFRVSAQAILVQTGQRGAVHAVQSAYRLDGKCLALNLLLLKKPRTPH